MNRRKILTGLGAAALGKAIPAQGAPRPVRIGFLSPIAAWENGSPQANDFLTGMAERGYLPGQNLQVERRGAMGRNGDLPRLAQELAAAGVDVIVVIGHPPALAARETGKPTVIVSGAGDPVATGLVQSLARPGGNVTGISDNATELSGKRLSLLREIVPGLQRVAMLWNQDDLGMVLRYRASSEVAERLGIAVQAFGVSEPDDFGTAFAAMEREKPDAILMVADALTILNRKRVIEFAARIRVPAIYETDFHARDGGLMSYGGDLRESFVRAAALTDQILQGAHPGELPFERPTRFKLVINLKTAQALGLMISPSLLAQADEVIE
jgi:putative tryptophan/tyrosine transport system substrate-binding protein